MRNALIGASRLAAAVAILHYPDPVHSATGIVRYARQLGGALRTEGEPVYEMPMRKMEVRIMGAPRGGLLSQKMQMLGRPSRRKGLLHSCHAYLAHPKADVVTVQDCFPEIYRKELGRTAIEDRLWAQSLARMVARGTHFVFSTAAVRTTFLGLHPEVDAGRTHVTPYGIDPKFSPSPPGATRHPAFDPHTFNVLAVSDLNPRKRLDWLLAAALEAPDVRVVHAGTQKVDRAAWQVQADRERPLADALGDRMRRLGSVQDDELLRLYQGADLLVMSSLDEGFGFPPLEALACGTPVLTLDRPVFREVLQDQAAYYPGPEALAQALERDRRNGPPSATARAARHAWVQGNYTWQRTAQRTINVYRTVEEEVRRRRSAPAKLSSSR